MITRARIEGMTCQHCVRAVFTALGGVEAVSRAEVSIGVIEVEHDGRVTLDSLRAAVELAGYRLVPEEGNRRALPLL
jgi:copper chaperone